MKEFRKYKRTNVAEMRPYEVGESLDGISVSNEDENNGSPKKGDMIARNPQNHNDQWLVAKEYFEANFGPLDATEKTLDNTTVNQAKDNVSDLEVFGDGDSFRLLFKASSKKEGWMKSTKAMFTGTGCVIQVTTQQKNIDGTYSVAEALTFVPGVGIVNDFDDKGKIIGRRIQPFKSFDNPVDS